MLNPENVPSRWIPGGPELRQGPNNRRKPIGPDLLAANRKLELERTRIAGLYRALSQANKVIVHALEETGLYRQICRVCADYLQIDLVFVSCPAASGSPLAVAAAAGGKVGCLDGLGLTFAPGGPPPRPSGRCLPGQDEQILQDWELTPASFPRRGQVLDCGLRSSAALPLSCEGRVVGLLNLYSAEPGFFGADRLELLREIAGDASFALDRFAREGHRQEAEEAFRATFEQAAVGIAHVSMGGRFLKLNQRFSEFIGYPEDELLGRADRDFTDPEDLDNDAEEIRALKAGLRPSCCWEKRYVCKEGRTAWARVTAAMLRDLTGAPTFLVYVVEDLTGQKRAEKERQELVESLHQAQKMESLGTLSAGIAHDMNNILAAIMGTAEVMQVTCSPEGNSAGNLATIIRASERGRDLVKKLIDFARKGLSTACLLDLNDLVRSELDLLRQTTLRNVEVLADLDPELPPVMGEGAAVASALMNLCVNGVQAMPEGGRLTIRTARMQDHGVELTVTDDGQGMSPEVLARAVEPFFTTKAVGKGTGLGLTIAFAVLKSHGGSLDIRSEAGRGTAVAMRFPGAIRETAQAEDPALLAPHAQRPVRVLIVDDDDLFLDTIPRLLVFMGHSAETAHSGQEALDRLEGGLAVDLVIMDQNMPGLSGTDTLDRLRQRWPDLPVIIGTGYLDAEAAAQATAHGHVQVLHKPYSRQDIRLAIDETLAAMGPLPG